MCLHHRALGSGEGRGGGGGGAWVWAAGQRPGRGWTQGSLGSSGNNGCGVRRFSCVTLRVHGQPFEEERYFPLRRGEGRLRNRGACYSGSDCDPGPVQPSREQAGLSVLSQGCVGWGRPWGWGAGRSVPTGGGGPVAAPSVWGPHEIQL